MPPRLCRYCGTDISALRTGSTVCRADACRTKRKTDWQRASRGTRLCLACHVPITTPKRRYCSDACYAVYRLDYHRNRHRANPTPSRLRSLQHYYDKRRGNLDVAARHLLASRVHCARHRDNPGWMDRRRSLTRAWRRDPENRAAERARRIEQRRARHLAMLRGIIDDPDHSQ